MKCVSALPVVWWARSRPYSPRCKSADRSASATCASPAGTWAKTLGPAVGEKAAAAHPPLWATAGSEASSWAWCYHSIRLHGGANATAGDRRRNEWAAQRT